MSGTRSRRTFPSAAARPTRPVSPGSRVRARTREPGETGRVGRAAALGNVLLLLVPLILTTGTFYATWWYVAVHNAPQEGAPAPSPPAPGAPPQAFAAPAPAADEPLQELGESGSGGQPAGTRADGPLE